MIIDTILKCMATAMTITVMGGLLDLMLIGIKVPYWVKSIVNTMMVGGLIVVFLSIIVSIWV